MTILLLACKIDNIWAIPMDKGENLMKRIIIAILVLAMMITTVAAFAGCENADYTVGIVQFAPHSALDASNASFQSKLKELMQEQGKTVKFIDNNANGDVSNATTAAETLVNRNVDLIFAVATPAAQAVQAATKTIPTLFTAVTSAKIAGLTDSNITGITDLNDVAKQVDLMLKLTPDADKFAILFSRDEPNSELQKDLAKQAMENKGIQVIEQGITDMQDVEPAFNYFKSEGVDCVYIPTDNRLAEGAGSVHSANISTKANLPIVCGETGMNKLCGIATYGVNYSKLGEQSAEYAFEILFNGKKPADLKVTDPVVTADDFSLNEDIAKAIGFVIPEEVKALAKQ